MLRLGQVGFSQRVRLEWLDTTAYLVMAGNDRAAVNAALQAMLSDKLSVGGHGKGGSRDKTMVILRKTWLTVPKELVCLRDEGLQLLARLPRERHLVVHWGMVMAVYPFWAGIAAIVGRLLRLQGSVAAAHVQRRAREQYGERETVSRAVRRILRSFHDWGVLQETGEKGVYAAGAVIAVEEPGLIAWLTEAALHSRATDSALLKEVLGSPTLFPLRLATIPAQSLGAPSPRLDILRQGLDEDVVVLQR